MSVITSVQVQFGIRLALSPHAAVQDLVLLSSL